MYEYTARVLSVHDGDTMKLEVDLGISVRVRLTVRLVGLNAPELATPEGKAARTYVQDWLARFTVKGEGTVVIATVKDRTEKYGRYLATVRNSIAAEARCLNTDLLADGHAQPYDGHGSVARGGAAQQSGERGERSPSRSAGG